MTDKDIIKALECCTKKYGCCDCPLGRDDLCMITINKEALDLIKRQQAEIEHLRESTKMIESEKDNLIRTYKECMTEAIKEFAEEFEKRCIASGVYPAVTKNILKNLVKELTEVSK